MSKQNDEIQDWYDREYEDFFEETENDEHLINKLLEALEWVNGFIPRGEPISFPGTRAKVDAAIKMANKRGYTYQWESIKKG